MEKAIKTNQYSCIIRQRCNKAIQPFDFDSDAGSAFCSVSFSLGDEVCDLISFYSIAIKSVYGRNGMAHVAANMKREREIEREKKRQHQQHQSAA